MAGAIAGATTISQIGDLAGSTDIPADTEVEWVLAADVTVTPETAAWWNTSMPLVKGGDVTWDGQDGTYSLTISGGESRAFVLRAPSSSDGYKWDFSGLRGLVVSGITSTGAEVYGGAIWVNDTGNSYPLNINCLFFLATVLSLFRITRRMLLLVNVLLLAVPFIWEVARHLT